MKGVLVLGCLALASLGQTIVFVNQSPSPNGGTARWSKLWIDPFGDNDLDSDAICYEDFTLAQDSTIRHIEWWGSHNPNLGFQIEFWRQDPGTIAYQPLAVFRSIGAQPEAKYVATSYEVAADPSGTVHFSYDLPIPVDLARNDPSNPRWFVAVIGLTNIAPDIWTWSQGTGGSHATFQWIRADGNRFHVLGEGRALLLSGTTLVPEPAGVLSMGFGLAYLLVRRVKRALTA